jgi:hypothetical protein
MPLLVNPPSIHTILFPPIYPRSIRPNGVARAREARTLKDRAKGAKLATYAPFLNKAYISRLHRNSVVLPHMVSNAEPLRSLISDANMRKQLIIHNSCKEHSMESR